MHSGLESCTQKRLGDDGVGIPQAFQSQKSIQYKENAGTPTHGTVFLRSVDQALLFVRPNIVSHAFSALVPGTIHLFGLRQSSLIKMSFSQLPGPSIVSPLASALRIMTFSTAFTDTFSALVRLLRHNVASACMHRIGAVG